MYRYASYIIFEISYIIHISAYVGGQFGGFRIEKKKKSV